MVSIKPSFRPAQSPTSKTCGPIRLRQWLLWGTLALVAGSGFEPVQASQPGSISAQQNSAQSRLAQAPSAQTAFTPLTGRLVTQDLEGRVNLRRQPAIASPVIAEGQNQAPLQIFKSALTPRGQRWYFVKHLFTQQRGWVHSDYVRLEQSDYQFTYKSAEPLQISPVTDTVNWDVTQTYGSELQPEAGIITAQDRKAWVNVRSQPSVGSAIRHRALPGDSIYIYQAAKFSSPNGRAQLNELWYFVAFLESGAEGWVRSDFVLSAWESDEPFEVHGFGPLSGRLSGMGSRISLYRYPSGSSDRPATEVVTRAQSGAAVTLLRKLETARGNPAQAWYWVRLASGEEGWVRGDRVTEGA